MIKVKSAWVPKQEHRCHNFVQESTSLVRCTKVYRFSLLVFEDSLSELGASKFWREFGTEVLLDLLAKFRPIFMIFPLTTYSAQDFDTPPLTILI